MIRDEKLQNKFNEIYETESDSLFRFCLIRVSNREQAMDITQEIFVRLWQALVGGKTMTNTRAFLFTIAHNLIIDWYRKKKSVSLESLKSDEDGEAFEAGDGISNIERELGAEGRYLMSKIEELEFADRNILYLRFIEGLPPAEIARILGVSSNATSVRLSRSLEKLRHLTGYDIDEGSDT